MRSSTVLCTNAPRRAAASLVVIGAALTLAGCDAKDSAVAPMGSRSVCVTTSYLECAVRDVAGDGVEVVRLLPPGGCPGHFDLTPRMIDILRCSAVLLRFDFQAGLDAKLARLKAEGLTVAEVPVDDGLCIPATYAKVCAAAREALTARWPGSASRFDAGLASTRARMEDLATELKDRVRRAELVGTKVLAGEHQAAFARWLGLDVVDTIPRGEEARIKQITDNLATGQGGRVGVVVANLQEGTRLAARLSDQLKARLVVFGNFPTMSPAEATFDDLVRANVSRLVQADRAGGAEASAP